MFPASNGTLRLLLILLHAGCLLLSLPLNASRYVAAAWSPISFSYNFTDPSSYDQRELRFEGDAAVNGGLVDLTCSSLEAATARGCTGRLSYGRHVLLYDDTTGSVGSFATRFTFNIKILPGHPRGDGMAFFLVGYPSEMPADSAGGALGLTNVKDNTALGPSRFVAVEFDTYNNSFEPQETMDHIGIHLSSIKDSRNTTNLTDFTLNGTMTASINFDGSTRMLVARLHFDDRPSMPPVEVSERLPHPETLLPPEVVVGFSASTTGESGVELHQILSWSFDSARPKETKSIGTGLIAGAIAGGACVFLLVVWFILSWFRWKRRRNSLMVSGAGPREFLYRDLAHATNNFSSERKLGKGAFGAVYRGTSLKVDNDGEERQVAVKELLKGSGLGGTKDFLTEVNTISKTKHKNLVKLEGWCSYSSSAWSLMFWCCCNRNQLDDHKLFLVYELMPKGDLDHHLHDKDVAVLPWPARYKIVKGVGSALVYLHHDCVPYILHRDIKPGNILLDDDYNAKLADFGLSRIANKKNSMVVDRCRLSWISNKSMSTVVITTAVGTGAYMDPKFKVDGDVTFDRSSDVYSFGLVLLEIACGRRNSRKEVWDLYERSAPKLKVEVVADERLGGDFDMEQMQRVLVVGLWCSLPDSAERPSMREAMRLLERDELPHLTSSPTSPLHEGSNETARTRRGTYSIGSRRLLYGSRRVLSL